MFLGACTPEEERRESYYSRKGSDIYFRFADDCTYNSCLRGFPVFVQAHGFPLSIIQKISLSPYIYLLTSYLHICIYYLSVYDLYIGCYNVSISRMASLTDSLGRNLSSVSLFFFFFFLSLVSFFSCHCLPIKTQMCFFVSPQTRAKRLGRAFLSFSSFSENGNRLLSKTLPNCFFFSSFTPSSYTVLMSLRRQREKKTSLSLSR